MVDEAWRISGGRLRCVVAPTRSLRELWNWAREGRPKAVDRPPFHIFTEPRAAALPPKSFAGR